MIFKKFYMALFSFAVLVPAVATAGNNTVLDQYISRDDGVFSYQQVTSIPQPGFTVYIYKLTSQKWRTESEVDRVIWEHQLVMAVPDTIIADKAILFILGGKNKPDFLIPDPEDLELLGAFALLTGTVAVGVGQVPNQPLTFSDEPQTALTEDGLVAYSWDTAMGTGDYTWSAYLPMAKSVIKAMDAVQMAADDLNLSPPPEEFVLVGFSKRGGTAWLSAIADHRVAALSPGVFDTLNFSPSIENQRLSYGEFNEVYSNYNSRNVLDRFRTREGQELISVVDPYEYRDRVTIPKYIVNVSGDQFFPPDSSLFYINDLAGESLLRYVPNTDHSGSNGGFENAMSGLLAWYQRIVLNVPRPSISWHKNDNNTLSVTVSDPSAVAVLWSASNPNARDFRMQTFGPNWHATPVPIGQDGVLEIPLEIPDSGWCGYFVEVTFPGIAGIPDKYSTPILILPETRPYNLAQPRFDPEPTSVWEETLASIIDGEVENQALVYSFPIRAIGDKSVQTVDDAYSLLAQNHANRKIKAQQACLTTRLNIKDSRIDWYSPAGDFRSEFAWELWNLADFLYRIKLFTLSEFTCNVLNR